MMRKLSRSLWYTMQHDLEFEYGKVFPGQPLEKRKVPHRRRQRRGASVGSGTSTPASGSSPAVRSRV